LKTESNRNEGKHVVFPEAAPKLLSQGLRFIAGWAGAAVIIAAGGIMLWWSWGKWPDVLVDFGRELYIPWQLSEGKILYTDIAFFNGPFSQYWNSIWFRLLGPSLRTLVFCNLAVLAAIILLLYHVLKKVAHRWSAVAGCLAFILLFAFAQFVPVGNYNYICPYSHEITHGLALSLAAVAGVWGCRRGGLPSVAGAGLALGLAFLTKAEVFVAGAASAVMALALMIWSLRPGAPRALAMGGTFLGFAALPPLLAFLALWRFVPPDRALAGTLGSWIAMGNSKLTNLKFYREGMGTSDVWGSFALMARWTGWYALILLPAALLSLALRAKGRHAWISAVVLLGVGWPLWAMRRDIEWVNAVRPLPLVVLAAAAVFAVRLVHVRHDPRQRDLMIRRLSLLVLAFMLLLKMILRARIGRYGFVLAMPATLIMVVTLLDWVPRAIERFGGASQHFRWAALGMLVVSSLVYLYDVQRPLFDRKNVWVGSGADAFLADPRGMEVNRVIRLDSSFSKDATVLVMPEGVMINYLARRRNPTPYTNFMPPEVIFFGEDHIVESLQANPPDFIVVIPKDTSEYGYRSFALDYGQEIGRWVDRNYRLVSILRSSDKRDPIAILKALEAHQTGHAATGGRVAGDERKGG